MKNQDKKVALIFYICEIHGIVIGVYNCNLTGIIEFKDIKQFRK
jgi:hypothetical protein